MKIACACYGNAGIAYQAMAALISIGRHNPDLDLFICATPDAEQLLAPWLNDAKIQFVAIDKEARDYLDQYAESARRYPKEMFLRYWLPLHFHKSGYDYAIMLDFDTICVKPINLAEFLPERQLYAGRVSGNLAKAIEPAKRVEVMKKFALSSLDQGFPNGGLLVFNLALYQTSVFFLEYRRVYNIMNSIRTIHPEDELALGLATLINKIDYKHLPSAYNHGAFTGYSQDSAIFHFNAFKPWRMSQWLQNISIYSAREMRMIEYILRCHNYNQYILTLPFKDQILPDGNVPHDDMRMAIDKLEAEYRKRCGLPS